MIRFVKYGLIVLLCFASSLSAQKISIKFDKDSILIGDHLLLNIQVEVGANERIFLPEFIDTLGNFDIIENYKTDTLENGLSQNILLTQFNAGIYQFGQIPALVQRENGRVDTLISNDILLTVSSMEVDTTQAIKLIKPVKSIPFPWKDFLKKLTLILLPIFLIIGIIIWYLIRKKKLLAKQVKPKTMMDFYEEAINRLQEIDKQKLWQNDQTKEYYLGISEVLRTYLEGRFGVAAMESTTDEIRDELFLDAGLKNKVCEVLAQADLAKFAKFRPLDDENNRMMKMAKDFVKHTKPKNLQEENDQ